MLVIFTHRTRFYTQQHLCRIFLEVSVSLYSNKYRLCPETSSLSPEFSSCLLRDFRPSLESFTDSRVQGWVGRPRGELLEIEGLPRLEANSEGCGQLGLDRFPSYDMEHASDPQRAWGRGEAWLCHLMNERSSFHEPREMVLWSPAT